MSGETKITEVASRIQERIPIGRSSFMRFFDWYHRSYIRTNSFSPVIHVIVAAGAIGYALEYPHIKHELEEAHHAASHTE